MVVLNASATPLPSGGVAFLTFSRPFSTSNNTYTVVGLTPDGQRDPAFGPNGESPVAVTVDDRSPQPLPTADFPFATASRVAALPDGRLVATGNQYIYASAALGDVVLGLQGTAAGRFAPATADSFQFSGSPDGTAGLVETVAGRLVGGGLAGSIPGFTGSVRVATADLTGDGVPDLIAGAGPGGRPTVRAVNGATGAELVRFDAFEGTFAGGVYITATDLTGDGVPELIVTPDRGGGPAVAVYDGAKLTAGQTAELARFFGIEDANFRGGARASAGDVDGDGRPELIVAAGFGGGPRVAVYAGTTALQSGGRVPRRLVDDFFVFEESLRNGVFVTALDLTGDGAAEVVVGGGPGGGSRVFALDGRALAAGRRTTAADFFAGDPATRGGVRLATRGGNLITGSGEGQLAVVRVYTPAGIRLDGNPTQAFGPFGGDVVADGVYVG